MKKLALSLALLLGLVYILMPFSPVQAESPRQEYISFQGVEIFTQAYNYTSKANEAIIYLPGLGSTHYDARFLHNSSNTYMTVSLDYLGHGKSGTLPNINWDLHLDSIKAVIDAYNINKVHLVGHSFGADTAMMFAKKYPGSVKDIVLIDRAYYNFAEIEQFNFTRSLIELLEYNPETLTYEAFINYLDMSYGNDISQTWDLKKKVLLLGGDPAQTFLTEPSIPFMIFLLKTFPDWFGLTQEQVAHLPDISEKDVLDLVSFLDEKLFAFEEVNHRFKMFYTPFSHRMVFEPEHFDSIRGYILGYLKNGKVQ
ncbi:MAG: alpha/beta hydrolase [Clostridia bacterium]|nr:alpha/beta hydrolase [Clostridia bacterium]